MEELADAPDLESGAARREGSSPFTRTKGTSFILVFLLSKKRYHLF